jgi:predicted NBD/HSP70 family sugar kinase
VDFAEELVVELPVAGGVADGDRPHSCLTQRELLCLWTAGCLGAVLFEHGLRRSVGAALGTAALPTLEEIARLAATDSLVGESVERAATHLADALLPTVQLPDPERVIPELCRN